MRIGEICSRQAVFIGRNESVADAARLMRQHHVGSLVVADKRDGRLLPAGMITDRDVAVGVVALGALIGLLAADDALQIPNEEVSALAAAVGLALGYLSHSASAVRLDLQETFTFRVLAPEAAAPLVYGKD